MLHDIGIEHRCRPVGGVIYDFLPVICYIYICHGLIFMLYVH
jgi:hypothetical protein